MHKFSFQIEPSYVANPKPLWSEVTTPQMAGLLSRAELEQMNAEATTFGRRPVRRGRHERMN